MSHDGNFQSLDTDREFCVGWRTTCAPHNTDLNWAVQGTCDISPVVWNDSGPHNGVGPGSVGNAQSGKASSIVLM